MLTLGVDTYVIQNNRPPVMRRLRFLLARGLQPVLHLLILILILNLILNLILSLICLHDPHGIIPNVAIENQVSSFSRLGPQGSMLSILAM